MSNPDNVTNNTYGSTISDSGTENQPNDRIGIKDTNMATTMEVDSVNFNDGRNNGKIHPMMSITEPISFEDKRSRTVQPQKQVFQIMEMAVPASTQSISGSADNNNIINHRGYGIATTDPKVNKNTTVTTGPNLITNSTDSTTTSSTTTDLGLIMTTTDSTNINTPESTDNTESIYNSSTVTETESDTTKETIDITKYYDVKTNGSTTTSIIKNNISTTTTDPELKATEGIDNATTVTDMIITGIVSATTGPDLN
jgi:hypothetical protein